MDCAWRRSAVSASLWSRHALDQLIMVSEAQLAQAIVRLLELEKSAVEGAAPPPLAALIGPEAASLNLAGKKVVLVITGGNIDLTLIARIIERGLAADGRLFRFVAYLPDRPGAWHSSRVCWARRRRASRKCITTATSARRI